MQVFVVYMLVPDDSEDNTQNVGVYATRALANAAVVQHAKDGLDCAVEEFPLVS
jgi:hypothetical protein